MEEKIYEALREIDSINRKRSDTFCPARAGCMSTTGCHVLCYNYESAEEARRQEKFNVLNALIRDCK